MIQVNIIAERPDSIIPQGLATALNEKEGISTTIRSYADVVHTAFFGHVLPVLLWETKNEDIMLQYIHLIRKTQDRVMVIAQNNISKEYIKALTMQGKTAVVGSESTLDELSSYITELYSGAKKWIFSPDILGSLIEDVLIGSNTDINRLKLSKKEKQVIEYAHKGLSIAETARELHLSANTVAAYRSRILKKTGNASINQLVAKYDFMGL